MAGFMFAFLIWPLRHAFSYLSTQCIQRLQNRIPTLVLYTAIRDSVDWGNAHRYRTAIQIASHYTATVSYFWTRQHRQAT